MEIIEVSEHLFRIYVTLRDSDSWLTAQQVAKKAKVAPRTARHHTTRLVSAGLLAQADVFPGPRYRFVKPVNGSTKAIVQKIEAAGKVFAE
jgi:predicted ArsR family transcriptional regulator